MVDTGGIMDSSTVTFNYTDYLKGAYSETILSQRSHLPR